jgi:hypothetical protein
MVEKDWTAEQANNAQKKYFQERAGSAHPRHWPLVQWQALNDLESEHKKFEAGDKGALLHAVALCAWHDLVMPDWVANEYIQNYKKVVSGEFRSWDEVFGVPHPNTDLKAMRLREERLPEVLFAIKSAVLDEGLAIEPGLFEVVGKRLSIGGRQVREFWYGEHPWAILMKESVDEEKKRRETFPQFS